MSGLLIGWGEIYPGCEERALRLFNEVVAYYGKEDRGRFASAALSHSCSQLMAAASGAS